MANFASGIRRFLGLLAAACAFAQDQPLVRVNTRLVEVDVIVRGKDGPITGLTQADFAILDKGKPQKITVFGVRASEDKRSSATPLPAGTVSNRVDPRGDESVAPTVILFDRLNTDAGDQTEARRQILNYIRSLSPGDHFALYSLYKNLRIVQDFTDDPGKLRNALDRAGAEASVDLQAADLISDLPVTGDALTDAMTAAAAKEMTDRAYENRAEITAYALQLIARHLGGLPGRKKLIWVGSAFPARYAEERSRVGKTQIEMRDFSRYIDKAVRSLNNANVAVYPVDPRGIITSFTAEGIDTMNLFANATGGKAFYVINDIEGAVRTAVNDSEVTYLLGFYPTSDKLDGEYHNLNVKVARTGVEVRARKGYFAAEGKSPSPKRRQESLNDAFLSPLESTGIGLAGRAVASPAEPGLYEFELALNLNEVHVEQEKGNWVALISIATEFPAKPKPNGSLEEIKITLTEARLKECLRDGYHLRRPFRTAGLSGNVRVVVQDRTTGEAGSLTLKVGQ